MEVTTLKISESAWHLRLYRYMKDSKTATPRDLCSYFWFFVGWSLFALLALIGALSIIIGTILLFIKQTEVMISVTILIFFIVGIGVVSYYYDRYQKGKLPKDKWGDPIPQPKKKKEPGIVRTYLKLRKEKFCPLIEVVPREGKKS